MFEKDSSSSPPPRKRGRWLLFLVGVVVGAAGATLFPHYAGEYLGGVFTPSAVVEGQVVEKESQAERIVLKVTTAEGVLLASFTENRPDIDLLVEPGASIRLGANRYQPFLENPTILSVREPAQAPKDVAEKSARQTYQEEMEAQLRKWEAKLAELEAIASRASDEAAQEYDAELELLREKRDAARKKLSELKSAGGVAWKDMKSGLDSAWSELEEALSDAASRFRDVEESSETEESSKL